MNSSLTSLEHEMTSTNESSPKQSLSTLTLDEQDSAVFGTINEQLADTFADLVQRAIQQGVESLPLLQDQHKSKTLMETIQKPYLKHIDLVELYGERNLFTLRHSGPKRRQNIVQRFQQEPSENSLPQAERSITSSFIAPAVVYPTKDSIPSAETLQNLQQELEQLAIQLKSATDRRNALIQQSVALDAAVSLTTAAVQSVQDAHVSVEPITATIMEGQGLQTLSNEGKRLQQELQNAKSDDMDEENPSSLPLVKKRVMTLEESYYQERQVLDATVENLASLSNLLKESKKKKKNSKS